MWQDPLLIGLILVAAIALGVWFLLKMRVVDRRLNEADAEARRRLDEARVEAERLKKEKLVEAKEEMLGWRAEAEKELQERRREIDSLQRRLDRDNDQLKKRQKEARDEERRLQALTAQIDKREQESRALREELQSSRQEQIRALEAVAGLTAEEARKMLVQSLQESARHDAAVLAKRIEEEARERAELEARKIITHAIQRCAAEHVVESSVAVVDLPSDDMKGRIIGREGRNIRALEQATGVDLIVDDTPEAVILSSFDPLRREIAKQVIERLIRDGRIHPARIEEAVEKVSTDMEQSLFQEGEAIAFELGIHDMHAELLRLLGRLKYRTSYGQNVLYHSREVAYLAGVMARELGVDDKVCIRAGLLHDVGKAVDREMEGTHLQLGVQLAKKYGECEAVVHAIEAHHFDVQFKTLEAELVQSADALSAARPGARREVLENYIKRLEKLENIAGSFDGVAKAFALQAGREVRILVESSKVSDEEAFWLSKDIAKKIEKDLQYPGQIKVTLIREMRVVDYAK